MTRRAKHQQVLPPLKLMKNLLFAFFMLLSVSGWTQKDSSYLQKFENLEKAPSFQNSTNLRSQSNHLKTFILPAAMATYGVVALNNNRLRNLDVSTSREMKEDAPHFKSGLDNYLQYAPAFTVYLLNAAGIKGKN